MIDYDPAEKIAILSPRSIDLHHIPGGYQRLTPTDIAARLAKVSKGASLLARAKYAGMSEVIPDLERWMMVQASGFIKKVYRKGMVRMMVKLALLETIHPKTCPWCKGTGWLPLELNEKGEVIKDSEPGKIFDCAPCRATGRLSYSQLKRSQVMEIPYESWRRKWAGVYDQVLSLIYRWEGEIKREISG